MGAGNKYARAEITTNSDTPTNKLVSAIISCILSLVIYGSLRFYADWFTSSQVNTIFGGFVGSWLFLLCLTSVSNVEMLVFGNDFQARIPEIIFSLLLSIFASGVVHRVCATTCIFFSIVGLYFVIRISNNYYNVGPICVEPLAVRKSGGKKHR